jgi:hypothetical protein
VHVRGRDVPLISARMHRNAGGAGVDAGADRFDHGRQMSAARITHRRNFVYVD